MGKMFGGGDGGSGWGAGQTPESPDLQGDGGPAISGGDGSSGWKKFLLGSLAGLGGVMGSQGPNQQGHPTQIDVQQTPQLPADFFQSPNLNPDPMPIDPLTGQPINRKPNSMFMYGGR